jgi:hypothetical protein
LLWSAHENAVYKGKGECTRYEKSKKMDFMHTALENINFRECTNNEIDERKEIRKQDLMCINFRECTNNEIDERKEIRKQDLMCTAHQNTFTQLCHSDIII